MNEPVLAHGTMRVVDIALLVAAGIVFTAVSISLLVAAPVSTDHRLWYPIAGCLVCAVAVAVAAIGIWSNRVRERVWLQDTQQGFLVIDSKGEHRIDDNEILAASLVVKQDYVAGKIESLTRRFTVWFSAGGSGPERLTIPITTRIGKARPL